jgi:hypothetical protein
MDDLVVGVAELAPAPELAKRISLAELRSLLSRYCIRRLTPEQLREALGAKSLRVARVYSDGHLHFAGERHYLSASLGGYCVGLEVLDAVRVRAWFQSIDLGLLDIVPLVTTACSFKPRTPREPKLAERTTTRATKLSTHS